jgi:glutamine amidotransferase-like uncharacterized protein
MEYVMKVLIYQGNGNLTKFGRSEPAVNASCARLMHEGLQRVLPGDTIFQYVREAHELGSLLGEIDARSVFLVIPGGNALRMKVELKEVSEKIQQFVWQGGCFLGSCAGAMVVASDIKFRDFQWKKTGPKFEQEERVSTYISFFGVAGVRLEHPALREELYSPSTHGNHRWPSYCAPEVRSLGAAVVAPAIWAGGAGFQKECLHSHDVKVLDQYASFEEAGQAATIRYTYGAGRMVLSMVHPEFTREFVRPEELSKDLWYWAYNVSRLSEEQPLSSIKHTDLSRCEYLGEGAEISKETFRELIANVARQRFAKKLEGHDEAHVAMMRNWCGPDGLGLDVRVQAQATPCLNYDRAA